MVGRADRVAVALGQLIDRLLLARGHERIQARLAVALALPGRTVGQPHAVVQVDDVDARDRAAALAVGLGVVEVRRHPDHEPVLVGFGDAVGVGEDQVRAGLDQVRAGGEVQMLDSAGRESRRRQRERGRHTDHCADDCSSQVRSSVQNATSLSSRVLNHDSPAAAARSYACVAVSPSTCAQAQAPRAWHGPGRLWRSTRPGCARSADSRRSSRPAPRTRSRTDSCRQRGPPRVRRGACGSSARWVARTRSLRAARAAARSRRSNARRFGRSDSEREAGCWSFPALI